MLHLKILKQEFNQNHDLIYHFFVPPSEVIYFGYILESLEGWAFYTTIDIENSVMLVEVIKDYVVDFQLLLKKIMNIKM